MTLRKQAEVPNIQRRLHVKLFLGSTTEEIEAVCDGWLTREKVCPGNLVESRLYKLGGVYQLVVWYAAVEAN